MPSRMIDPAPRKAFVVDMDASILRKLGKHARALYNALRYMADGKSGELRFRERWYKAKEFDREAKMCERVRLAAMRELVAAGLVTFTRPRVCRMIGGRLRAVAGSVHYVVHRQPVPVKNRQKTRDSSKLHLQNCIPGSPLEMQSQIVPNPPLGTGSVSVSVLPLNCSESSLGGASHRHHRPESDEDDDTRSNSFQTEQQVNPIGKISVEERTKAKNIPTALRSWMDARILARAQDPVRSRGAYLLASRPAFLESMVEEIELFLTEKAEEFMRKRIEEASVVNFKDVFNLLVAQTKKHELPVGIDGDEREDRFDVFERIFDNASEIIGLEDTDEGDARETCQDCGSEVLRSAIEAHAKVCRAAQAMSRTPAVRQQVLK